MSGLREQKKAATRQAIADAAIRVFSQTGIAGVTVASVAEEAHVSVRTFHNYFGSVAEALQFVYSKVLDEFAQMIRTAPPETDVFTCFEQASAYVVHMVEEKGWEGNNPIDIGIYLASARGSRFADQCQDGFQNIRAAIAERESQRLGQDFSPNSLHVCLVFHLGVAAAKAVVDVFDIRLSDTLASKHIPTDEFIAALHESFSTVRHSFLINPPYPGH